MPSFDAVSEIDHHELTNAVNQSNQEISRRFDLKDSQAKIELDGNIIKVIADDDFQVEQVEKILKDRLIARKIELKSLDDQGIELSLIHI